MTMSPSDGGIAMATYCTTYLGRVLHYTPRSQYRARHTRGLRRVDPDTSGSLSVVLRYTSQGTPPMGSSCSTLRPLTKENIRWSSNTTTTATTATSNPNPQKPSFLVIPILQVQEQLRILLNNTRIEVRYIKRCVVTF